MFRCGVERALERRAHGQHNTRAGLALPQPKMRAVIGRPRQPQQIALPLPGPQREQQWQMQMRRRGFEKRGLVVGGPNLVGAVAAIEPPAARASSGDRGSFWQEPTASAIRLDERDRMRKNSMSHKLAVTLVAACLFVPPLALAAGPGGGTGAVGGGGASGGGAAAGGGAAGGGAATGGGGARRGRRDWRWWTRTHRR